jgi:hypothetical protein
VGLRQAARQLGIHRDARKARSSSWALPPLERRVGWQPSQDWTTEAKPNAPVSWPDWVRDVTFAEDTSQVHTGTAPQLMPCLRNLAIGLLSRVGPVGLAAALRRHRLLATGGTGRSAVSRRRRIPPR